MSFWLWMEGKDDIILTVSVFDGVAAPLAAVVVGNQGKEWKKVSLNLEHLNTGERKKVNNRFFIYLISNIIERQIKWSGVAR